MVPKDATLTLLTIDEDSCEKPGTGPNLTTRALAARRRACELRVPRSLMSGRPHCRHRYGMDPSGGIFYSRRVPYHICSGQQPCSSLSFVIFMLRKFRNPRLRI